MAATHTATTIMLKRIIKHLSKDDKLRGITDIAKNGCNTNNLRKIRDGLIFLQWLGLFDIIKSTNPQRVYYKLLISQFKAKVSQ